MRCILLLVAAAIFSAPYAPVASANDLPDGKAMPDSAIAAPQPPGFVSFCMRFAAQCVTDMREPKTLSLTAPLWNELEKINAVVNRAIRPKSDLAHYGRQEYWTIPDGGWGDCEDYALAKRKQLMDLGMPPRALRIAVVRTGMGMDHAVLTVTTDHGDYVLDIWWARSGAGTRPAISGSSARIPSVHGAGYLLMPSPVPLATAASIAGGQG
jgi:predicted transglutaminase-like cysteine proteinase